MLNEIWEWIQLYSFLIVIGIFVIIVAIIKLKEHYKKKRKDVEDVPPMPPKSFYDMPLDVMSNLNEQKKRAEDELKTISMESKKLAKDMKDVQRDYAVQMKIFKQKDESIRIRWDTWSKNKVDFENLIERQKGLEESKEVGKNG